MNRSSAELWELVARHPDIDELGPKLWPLLEELTGAGQAWLWLLDQDRLHTELLAHTRADKERPKDPSPATFTEMYRWCQSGKIENGLPTHAPASLGGLVPARHAKGLWVPIPNTDGPAGILTLASSHAFTAAHASAMSAVQAPLAVALRNHQRWHALSRAQEAYAADKQALLTRLDRQDMSESIIGAETGLREVVVRIQQVAHTEVPVLILGETGAGKEVVARTVHQGSQRKEGPLVRVNCGAIPSELVDSELFGHEQGGFTGATATRKGWFERADGGTLFLDEIGELPLAAQVRLLRVLQDGMLERVGGHKPLKVDVRIVAATHRDLAAMVRTGTFREDLWYRISVFTLRLPPLRERREDIPALAAHFANRAMRRLGGMAVSLTQNDVALLVGYEWPGNVRELAAVMERAAILGNAQRLEIAGALGAAPVVTSPALATPRTREASLDSAMVQHIEAALAKALGRVEGPFGAAKTLDINPQTLRARMRKLGIDWRRFKQPAS